MRNSKGQSLCELAAGLIVAIPIFLALVDCSFLLIGAAAADNLCRDAARAAASGPPSILLAGERVVTSTGEPVKRAKAVMHRVYRLGLPITVREEELRVVETLQNPMPDATTGGSINGTVVVNSTVDVYPPFILGVVNRSAIPMKSRHGFPFTYVVPMAATAMEP